MKGVINNSRGQLFWKALAIILAILLIILILVSIFIYYVIFNPKESQKDKGENPFKDQVKDLIDEEDVVIQDNTNPPVNQIQKPIKEEHISYVLYELEADKLHNPPASAEIPVMRLDVDGTIFMARVINNEITVEKGKVEGEDIRVITTRKAIIDAVKSDDAVQIIRGSINSGESKLEIVSDRKELLMKGYLDIYKELTREQVEAYYSPPEKIFNISIILIAIILVAIILILYLKIFRRRRRGR